MSVIKLHNGAWQVSAIVRGYLVVRTYYGYSKRDAKAMYRAEVLA